MAKTTTTSTTTTGTTASRGATARATPILHAVLRIGAGLLFMEHGAQKLFGWFGGFGGEPGGTAELMSLMGLAGVLEFFGGALIVLGLLTRPVALILAIEMVVAYFMAHAPQGGVPMENGGELTLLYALVFAFFAASGSGPAALDRSIKRKKRDTPRNDAIRS